VRYSLLWWSDSIISTPDAIESYFSHVLVTNFDDAYKFNVSNLNFLPLPGEPPEFFLARNLLFANILIQNNQSPKKFYGSHLQ